MATVQSVARSIRKDVKAWLEAENAPRVATLQLLDVIYAGAIRGWVYGGRRPIEEHGSPYHEATYALVRAALPSVPGPSTGDGCGCLVDTLERIQQTRPTRQLTGATARVFGFATGIPVGATPLNHPYARAAARGVEDYYTSRGWK